MLNLFPGMVSIGDKYHAIGGERSCNQPSPKYVFSFLSFSPSFLASPWSIPVLHAQDLTMQCGLMAIGDLMIIGCRAIGRPDNSPLSRGDLPKGRSPFLHELSVAICLPSSAIHLEHTRIKEISWQADDRCLSLLSELMGKDNSLTSCTFYNIYMKN